MGILIDVVRPDISLHRPPIKTHLLPLQGGCFQDLGHGGIAVVLSLRFHGRCSEGEAVFSLIFCRKVRLSNYVFFGFSLRAAAHRSLAKLNARPHPAAARSVSISADDSQIEEILDQDGSLRGSV